MTDRDWSYFETCLDASEELAPVALGLGIRDIRFRIDQTGGFIMVLFVPTVDGREIGITREDTWWVYIYDWEDNPEDEGTKIGHFESVPEVMDAISEYVGK